MEEEGKKRVEISGMNDKRQITMVLGVCNNSCYLSPQVICAGKTNRCLPKVKFPAGWHVTCTENHSTNEVTSLQYIDEILVPYVHKTREELSLSPNHTCLVIFNRSVLKALEENNILVVLVPANCTDRLQPLGVVGNKPVNEFLRAHFHDWYSWQICSQLDCGTDKIQPVNLCLAIMKPLSAA